MVNQYYIKYAKRNAEIQNAHIFLELPPTPTPICIAHFAGGVFQIQVHTLL
jgi:hypothetical protein